MSKYRHAKKPGTKQIAIIGAIAVGAIVLIAGVVFAVTQLVSGNEDVAPTVATSAVTAPVTTEVPTEPHTQDPQLKYAELAKEYLDTMTVDEKIYQMLLVTPESLTGVSVVTEAGDTTKAALEEKPVGGIYYTQQNFGEEQAIKDLITNTKSYAKTPLYIAIQEEGGENSPLASALEIETPDNMSTYSTQGESVAFKNADTIATYLNKYGFNMNFAPYAGLTGDNSFSEDPATAGSLVSQAMHAYQSKSIVSVVHSFPDANENDETYENMKTKEFVPYATAIKDGADVMMVSTSKALSIDEHPAFMADIIVKKILIEDLQYNNLIITAPISQSTVPDEYTVTKDIITSAINNGVNMFVCPSDIDTYFETIKTALDEKLITQQQIDECVSKILMNKFKYGIISEEFNRTPVPTETPTQTSSEAATDVPTNPTDVVETQPATDPTQA